jgi:hypothetical protein
MWSMPLLDREAAADRARMHALPSALMQKPL